MRIFDGGCECLLLSFFEFNPNEKGRFQMHTNAICCYGKLAVTQKYRSVRSNPKQYKRLNTTNANELQPQVSVDTVLLLIMDKLFR